VNQHVPTIGKFWSEKQRAHALAVYLENLFEEEGVARKFVRKVVETRYSHFLVDEAVDGLDAVLQKGRENYKIVPNADGLHENLKREIVAKAKEVRQIFSQMDQGEKQIELANYIEDISNYVLGNTLHVDPFLRSFSK